MFWTIAILATLLWALGLVTSHPMGGFIHLFLVLAVAMVIFRGLRRRTA